MNKAVPLDKKQETVKKTKNEAVLQGQPQQDHAPNQALLSYLAQAQTKRHAAEEGICEKLSQRFQIDLSGLKIMQDDSLQDVGQASYARGNEIHIGTHINPATAMGEKILVHEAAHVLQQGTGMAAGNGILESSALETHADYVMNGGAMELSGFSMPDAASAPIQGWDWWDKHFNKERYQRNMQTRATSLKDNLINGGNREPYEKGMNKFMTGMGYGQQTEIMPYLNRRRYDNEGKQKTGMEYGAFMRELTGGVVTDNHLNNKSAPERMTLKHYDRSLTEGLMSGDRDAYERLHDKYVAGMNKFAKIDFVSMDDAAFLKNYPKYYAMSRHAVSQKQLYEKTLIGKDINRDPAKDAEFENAAYYMETLAAYMQNRLSLLSNPSRGNRDAIEPMLPIFQNAIQERRDILLPKKKKR